MLMTCGDRSDGGLRTVATGPAGVRGALCGPSRASGGTAGWPWLCPASMGEPLLDGAARSLLGAIVPRPGARPPSRALGDDEQQAAGQASDRAVRRTPRCYRARDVAEIHGEDHGAVQAPGVHLP